MIKLIIKKADGSDYWIDHFNSLSQAQTWLNEEKTRKYWKQEYTSQFIDLTPPEPTQAEKDAIAAAEAAKQAQLLALKTRINELDNLSDLTAAELKENLRKLVKFLKVKGLLD